MAKVTLDMPIQTVKELLTQLTPQELQTVLMSLQDRLESFHMMQFAESAFSEWLNEDDLYSHG